MLFNFIFLSKNGVDIVEIFKQKKIRFKLIEHPIMMIIGFFIFILLYKKLYKNQPYQKITRTVLFLFFLSVLTFMIRFPFNSN
ncbi:hypothetical protein [Blattabacterium cuenoti]|uniref:hypothetical protein n=1 Tax=Blattabacterium cuenoti TaxID=1653831 RepID=UPI00163D1AE7|nr:hypothetical protein [Blattabacterium cuenoti]